MDDHHPEQAEANPLLFHQECQPVKQPAEKQSPGALVFARLQQKQRRRHREQYHELRRVRRHPHDGHAHRHDAITGARHQPAVVPKSFLASRKTKTIVRRSRPAASDARPHWFLQTPPCPAHKRNMSPAISCCKPVRKAGCLAELIARRRRIRPRRVPAGCPAAGTRMKPTNNRTSKTTSHGQRRISELRGGFAAG